MSKISVLLPVLINEPWQIPMTECAIQTMRCTTDLPFEIVIVETVTQHFEKYDRLADYVYIHIPVKSNIVEDLNRGLDACKGDFVVHTGNDIFMKSGWLEEMVACFEIPDCGAATLASSDLKGKISPCKGISEGVYGPLFMFRNGWRFDTDYKDIFSDTDMIMRMYTKGFRSYRNWNVTVTHLYQQTCGPMNGEKKLADAFEVTRKMFMEKHRNSPTLMFKILSEGHVV